MRDTVRPAPTRSIEPAAAVVASIGAATVAAVWFLQARGYNPCELCLKERVPFYVGVPLAAALAVRAGPGCPAPRHGPASRRWSWFSPRGAVLGAYHAGVEWKLWAGPTGCSGAAAAPAAVADFLKQLDSVTVVRCDEAALQVLGLSLAAWNALLSAGLAGVAALGVRRAGR